MTDHRRGAAVTTLTAILIGCDDPNAECGQQCQAIRALCDAERARSDEANDLDRERRLISRQEHERRAHAILMLTAACRIAAKREHGAGQS